MAKKTTLSALKLKPSAKLSRATAIENQAAVQYFRVSERSDLKRKSESSVSSRIPDNWIMRPINEFIRDQTELT